MHILYVQIYMFISYPSSQKEHRLLFGAQAAGYGSARFGKDRKGVVGSSRPVDIQVGLHISICAYVHTTTYIYML